MVMATQNPIEQQGTYPLPEAQFDRFMLHVKVGYPTRDQERTIMERAAAWMLNRPTGDGHPGRAGWTSGRSRPPARSSRRGAS